MPLNYSSFHNERHVGSTTHRYGHRADLHRGLLDLASSPICLRRLRGTPPPTPPRSLWAGDGPPGPARGQTASAGRDARCPAPVIRQDRRVTGKRFKAPVTRPDNFIQEL
ncbi:hypothetical protein DKM19_32300 [Streptosporangium sp. 'caverna']|nr:hypothetical protein DKM19_32300 [Streptosporangium sp. 'caverna']